MSELRITHRKLPCPRLISIGLAIACALLLGVHVVRRMANMAHHDGRTSTIYVFGWVGAVLLASALMPLLLSFAAWLTGSRIAARSVGHSVLVAIVLQNALMTVFIFRTHWVVGHAEGRHLVLLATMTLMLVVGALCIFTVAKPKPA